MLSSISLVEEITSSQSLSQDNVEFKSNWRKMNSHICKFILAGAYLVIGISLAIMIYLNIEKIYY